MGTSRRQAGAKRTTPSKAREAEAMGTLLGKAIGHTERVINKTAKTVQDFLS
jgi:hypothetical protein